MRSALRRDVFLGLGIALCAGISVPAAAQLSETEFIACAAKVDQEERLTCYDGIAARLNEDARRVVAERAAEEQRLEEARAAEAERLAAAQAAAEAARQAEMIAAQQQTVESAFGAEDIRPGSGREARAQDSISSSLAQLIPGNQVAGNTFVLENGQAWRQKDGRPLNARPGSEITISRAALSGYELRVTGRKRTVRVDRIR